MCFVFRLLSLKRRQSVQAPLVYSRKYAVWIPFVVFALVHAATQVSLLARKANAVSEFYLPTAVGIVLVHWLGPRRVVPYIYLNGVIGSYFWGNPIDSWPRWFLFAVPETVAVFLSWHFFSNIFKGKTWLPNIHETLLFLSVGVLAPTIAESLSLQGLMLWNGTVSAEMFWTYVLSNVLSEITATFFVTLPCLYYLTPILVTHNLIDGSVDGAAMPRRLRLSQLTEMTLLLTGLAMLMVIVDFRTYWYVYGFASLYFAIRFGFGPALISNFFILLTTYLLPRFTANQTYTVSQVNEIFIPANFLFLFAVVTGRIITDLRIAEEKLLIQNNQLQKANEELDQFVYSVSHDLSAPLKTILGLVNISRLTSETRELRTYFDRIERSVIKLENFITQILDYSKNQRQGPKTEAVDLREICREVIDSITPLSNSRDIEFVLRLQVPTVVQDKVRLRIVLNNLITNAVKFQKRLPEHTARVIVSTRRFGEVVELCVEDNGEGIRPENIDSLFTMFYRGHERSTGSGLGLYIAKEAAQKIGGELKVTSVFGEGAMFTLTFQDRAV
jgi:two-component system, sensor histidine kinase